MDKPPPLTKEMIEQLFDATATSYDRTGPDLFARFGERLVELFSPAPGAHVLDIATGTGAVLLPAARRVGPQGRVIGIDLSSEILREAENSVREQDLSNVELLKMDAEHLEFPDRSFDVVTCAFGLFFFPGLQAALAEMYRVCKPGGQIVVTTFAKAPPMFGPGMPLFITQCIEYGAGLMMPQQVIYDPEEVQALLSPCGLHTIETHSEENDLLYESLDDWWAFMMTLGPRAMYLTMDEDTRFRFKEEYLAKLRPMLSEDGLHTTLGVIYAGARR